LPTAFMLFIYCKNQFRFLFLINFLIMFVLHALVYEQTTMMVMNAFLPLAFYAIVYKWEKEKIIKHFLILSSSTVLAIICVLGVHFYALVQFTDLESAKDWFIGKFFQRTYSELQPERLKEVYHTSKGNKSSLFQILKSYFVKKKTFLNVNIVSIFIINALLFIITFYFVKFRKVSLKLRKILGLNIICFLSLFSVFCYFVLFKSQAGDHHFPIQFFMFPYVFFFLFSALYTLSSYKDVVALFRKG